MSNFFTLSCFAVSRPKPSVFNRYQHCSVATSPDCIPHLDDVCPMQVKQHWLGGHAKQASSWPGDGCAIRAGLNSLNEVSVRDHAARPSSQVDAAIAWIPRYAQAKRVLAPE